jgi:hypothetical protein
MYVMMGVMALMMFAMPRMMDNMDPEARGAAAALQRARETSCGADGRVARCAGAEGDAGADGQGRHDEPAAGAQAARVSRSCRDPFLTLLSAFAQGVLNGDPPPSAKKKAAGGGGGGGGGGGAGDAKKKAAKQG